MRPYFLSKSKQPGVQKIVFCDSLQVLLKELSVNYRVSQVYFHLSAALACGDNVRATVSTVGHDSKGIGNEQEAQRATGMLAILCACTLTGVVMNTGYLLLSICEVLHLVPGYSSNLVKAGAVSHAWDPTP